MNKDEALKMAIEALEGTPEGYSEFRALQACKEALAQPQPKLFLDLSNSNGNHPVQQEPVGIVYNMQDGYVGQMVVKDIPHKTKLYTHPAPSWQGLSDYEIDKIYFKTFDTWSSEVDAEFARAIEQALKERNK